MNSISSINKACVRFGSITSDVSISMGGCSGCCHGDVSV